MFSAELERKQGVEATLQKNLDGTQLSMQLCPALLPPLSVHSWSSWNFLQLLLNLSVAPCQPHPDEGSNKSLQMWAEHSHPREELVKYSGNMAAFIWHLFNGTTRFYPEKQWFAQISDLSQSSVKSREYLPCSRNRDWTKASGIFSVVPRKSVRCRSVHFLSWTAPPPKMVTK